MGGIAGVQWFSCSTTDSHRCVLFVGGKPNMHNWAVVALEFKMLLTHCLFSRGFSILFTAVNLAGFND